MELYAHCVRSTITDGLFVVGKNYRLQNIQLSKNRVTQSELGSG